MVDIVKATESKLSRTDERNRLQADRTALVVVDMQRGFLEPGAALELPAGRELIPNLQLLITTCRRVGIPVIFTEYVYATSVPCQRGDPFGPEHLPARPGEQTGYGLPSDNCLIPPLPDQGANSAGTIAELAPEPGELVVQGHTYDKFYGTPLDLALRSRDIRCLVMTGIVAELCVNCTLFSAANRDYRVTAVTDGIKALSDESMDACCQIWQYKFARLRTTQQVVAEIEALG